MKQLAYSILRYFGVYWLARKFFRKQLLILCYHGISVRDEHQWWPGVFMRGAVFRRRLELLWCSAIRRTLQWVDSRGSL